MFIELTGATEDQIQPSAEGKRGPPQNPFCRGAGDGYYLAEAGESPANAKASEVSFKPALSFGDILEITIKH